ncbi:energy transducer TonB [bacterium]|nr:energy transducer TonB [bacterium]
MVKVKGKPFRVFRCLIHRALVGVGAVGLSLALFLVLPLMQTLTKPPVPDLLVREIDRAQLEPPPPPPPEEKPREPEREEPPPPQLTDEAPPLDLAQLELALNPGFGDGLPGADFGIVLKAAVSHSEDVDALFSISDLDQPPRVIYQPSPMLTREARKKAPATVYIIFAVDRQGRVEEPRVQKSTDPVFEQPALAAVKQWKFEPGRRNGEPVRFRMRVPISFPKGN